MADTTAVNPLAWNFDTNNYLKPLELRSGGSTPSSKTTASSSFGDYSSTGMSGIFDEVGSLCDLTDSFTAQNASIIAKAEAQNNQKFAQDFANAQQKAEKRDQLRALGIDPSTVLGTEKSVSGGTGNTDILSSLLGGNTSTPQYEYSNDPNGGDDSSSSDDAFWSYIDAKVAKSKGTNQYQGLAGNNSILTLLLNLLGGGISTQNNQNDIFAKLLV
jgi:hypothetical protein